LYIHKDFFAQSGDGDDKVTSASTPKASAPKLSPFSPLSILLSLIVAGLGFAFSYFFSMAADDDSDSDLDDLPPMVSI
jgi:hypothetical protein